MERIEEIPQIIRIDAAKAAEDLLPSKSKESYLKEYETFKEWRKEKKITDVCEDVMLAYFNEKSEKYKSSSLWAQYSMLKATMNIYENVDMSIYLRLIAFLKDKHVGYEAKKSKVLTRQQIVEFLNSAPDDIFLMEKVAVVFGVSGACRCDELYSINVDYVQDKGNLLVVTIPRTNTNKRRVFTIMADDEMNGVDLYRKYLALRPKKVEHPSLFVSMRRGKCTVQRVGINSFYKIAKTVATYLKLEEPETYTGHSLRRSSATLLAESGTEIIPHKRHGSWRTGNAAEGYVEDSLEHRSAIARQYMGGDVQAGYDSSGDTFLMNQMADQNTSSGAASPGGRSAVLAAGVPASHRRLASMARARVTAGSARTARLFAQARARRLHQQQHHHHRRRRQQQRRQSHAATPTTSTAEDEARRKAAKTARAALGTSPAAARSMERLLSKWSPVVVLHDIAKSLPATAATTSKTKPPLREATAPESEHSASGRQRQDADSPSTVVSEAEEVAAAAAASQREDAEDSSPSSVVSVAGSEDGVVRSAAPGDAPVTASSKAPGRGDAVTITQDDGEEVPLSAVAPVTPSPSAASARPAGRRAPSDSAVPETASLPPGGTSLDLDRPLASRTGAGARQRKASTSAEVAMRTPRKQTASAPPASEQPLRATRRSTAGGDKRRPEASTQKPLSARKRSRKLDAVTSKAAEAPEGVPDAVAGPSSAGTAAPDRPKSRAQSAPPQESSGKTGPRRKSRRISEAATSAGADTATNASVADEDDRLLSERLVSRSQSAPPQETSDESKKAQRKRSRKKSEAATSAAADSATPATGASASTPEIVADGGESPLPERSVSRSRSAPPQETTDGGKKAPRRRSGKTSEAATCVVADIATEASGDAKTAPVTVVDAGEELTSQPLSKRSMSRSEPAPPQESSAGKALRKRSRKKSETRTYVVADIVIERSGDDDSTPVTVVAAGEELTAQPLSERSVPRTEPAPPQETSAGKTARKRSRKKSEAAASVVADIVIETSGDGDSSVVDAGEELTAQPLSERSVSRSEPAPPQETSAGKAVGKRSRKKSETRTSVVADIVIERSGDDDSTPVTVVAAGEELTAQPLSERSVPRTEPAPPQETSAGKTARKRSRKKSEAAASVVADIVIETSGDGDSSVVDAGEELTAQPLSERSVSRSEPAPPQETSAGKAVGKRSRKKSETATSVVADIVIETSGDGDSSVVDAGEELTAQPLSERSVSRSESAPPQETSAEKTARKRSRKKSETPASENVESAPKSAVADPPEVITFAPPSVADDLAESSDKSDDLPLSHLGSSESTRLRETSAASPVVVELESSPSPEETSALCHLPSFSPLPDRSLSDDYMSAIDDEDVLLDPGATPRSEMSGRMSVMSDYSTASLWTETCPSPPRDATGQYMYSPLDDDAPVVIKRKTRRKSGQYVYTLMDDDDDMPLEARASPEPPLAERWGRSRSATPGAERSSKAGARRGKADRKAAAAGWRSADELTPDAHASRRRRPRGRPRKVASEGRGKAAASRRSASRARSATPAKDDLREIDGAAAAVAAVGAASLMAEHFPTAVTCETCGSQLGSVADLRRHVLYKHTLSPLAAAKEKRWRCRECGRPFVHESSLRSHEKRAHERPHACAHCAERFALAADLLAHRAARHRGKAEAEEEVASD